MPADNVYATKLMVEDISKHYSKDNLVIVSPDVVGSSDQELSKISRWS